MIGKCLQIICAMAEAHALACPAAVFAMVEALAHALPAIDQVEKSNYLSTSFIFQTIIS